MRALLVLAMVCGIARADEAADRAKARELGIEGMRKLNDGVDFAGASDLFQRAYDLSKELPYLINVAVTLRKAGLPQLSVEAYRRCLAEGGTALTPALRAQITADIEHIIAESAQVTVRTSGAPATIELDHRKVGTAAKDAPLLVLVATGGKLIPTLVALRLGHTAAEQRLEKLEPGKAFEVELEPTPIPTTGRVTITSDPPGARLVVAGHQGLAPQTFELPPADYDIAASLPDHDIAHQTVQLRAGDTRQVAMHLRRTQHTWWERNKLYVYIGGAVALATGAGIGIYYGFEPNYGYTIRYRQ